METEYQFCSRRGVCDMETGRCDCIDGFSRANCDFADSSITEEYDIDVLLLHATAENFTGELSRARERIFLLFPLPSVPLLNFLISKPLRIHPRLNTFSVTLPVAVSPASRPAPRIGCILPVASLSPTHSHLSKLVRGVRKRFPRVAAWR